MCRLDVDVDEEAKLVVSANFMMAVYNIDIARGVGLSVVVSSLLFSSIVYVTLPSESMLVVGRHCGCNCNRAAKGGKNVDDDDAVDAPTTSRVNVIANARRSILFTARWLNNNSNYGNVI